MDVTVIHDVDSPDYGRTDLTKGMGWFRKLLFYLGLDLIGVRLRFMGCPFCGSWKKNIESSSRFSYNNQGSYQRKEFTISCGKCDEFLIGFSGSSTKSK
jgi:hypothetical protein